jgi:hypothetical protein
VIEIDVGIESEELTHFLNELLEAERAGARVTLIWATILAASGRILWENNDNCRYAGEPGVLKSRTELGGAQISRHSAANRQCAITHRDLRDLARAHESNINFTVEALNRP